MKIIKRALALLLVYHLTLVPIVGETGKGPASDRVPDLDDVISNQREDDADSLADLEKVIEEEEASSPKDSAKTPPKTAQKSAPPAKEEGLKQSEIDDALLLDDSPAGSADATPPVDRNAAATVGDAKDAPPPTSEPDLSADLPSDLSDSSAGAPAPAEDLSNTAPPEDIDSAPPPTENAERPAISEPLPRSDVKNQITNLEFKMEGQNSRIVVSSRGPLRYREVRNPQVKQVVYFFENTETPNRLQRAYDTTEFVSPVALFTVLQMPKEVPPVSKLIVQLREDKAPSLTPNEKGLIIDFPPPDIKEEQRLILGDNDPKLATEENIYSGNQTFSGKTISRLEVKNSDVQDILRLIAKSSGYNIVIGDDVQGKVGTLSLQNVPWDQAFTLVLQTKKLGYIRQGNVIRVATLSALKSEKEESIANEQSRIRVEPLRTVLIPISYAKAGDLSQQAKSFLSERGTLDIDTRTNTIIIKDIDRSVSKIQKLFAVLDTPPARVSITAKLVEMSSQFTREIGFNRLSLAQDFGGLNLSAGMANNSKASNFITLNAPTAANLFADFKLAEIDNKVRTLASPSVTVVANQPATVNSSINFFVFNSDSVAGGQIIPGVRQITATLTMNVTPIVAGDGSIFMQLSLKNEVPRGVPPNLVIDSRQVDTQILIDNGDTAVVGGIFQNTVLTAKSGIPFLMNIPILGFLFSNNNLSDTKNEVFMFITAKIMNAEDTFKRSF